MKNYSLNKPNLKINIKNYYEYLSPKNVFVNAHMRSEIDIAKDTQIYKEQILRSNNPVYSPVSGRYNGIIKFKNYANLESIYFHIINDYKEIYKVKKNINRDYEKYTKLDIIEKLDKYQLPILNDIKNFLSDHDIISGINIIGFDDYLYNYNNYYYISTDGTKIFDMLSLLGKILDSKILNLLVKNTSNDSIKSLSKVVGTYPEISVKYLPDVYPLSNINILKHYINNYDNNTLVLDIYTLKVLYGLIVRDKIPTEKVICITNLITNEVSFCNTKIGVLLINILKEYDDKYIYYINNPLNSSIIDPKTTIIDIDVNTIVIDNKAILKPESCINCGTCLDVCPLVLKDLTKNPLCIKCNLCSYMCPSNINLLRGDENE